MIYACSGYSLWLSCNKVLINDLIMDERAALTDITELWMDMSHVCLYVAHRNILISVSSVASALTTGQEVRWVDGYCYLGLFFGF